MKIYNLVLDILEKSPGCRDSNKRLIWNVWHRLGFIQVYDKKPLISKILFMDYMNTPQPESITRAKRLIQADPKYKHLRSSKRVQIEKNKKEATKGTFAYREEA